jgi:Mn2+/Fe2+ NRAMP family transporter
MGGNANHPLTTAAAAAVAACVISLNLVLLYLTFTG